MGSQQNQAERTESSHMSLPPHMYNLPPLLQRIFYVHGHTLVVKGFLCLFLIQDESNYEPTEKGSDVF